ncbi:SDR family NAD(P)-dependent oxidoreductase [Rhizohabitans arisaemae]|uniref:SDR family NAD(P)-dependent oxidoreductase n=1 Tax=Rhizohabitans arisaemae TaxID=2720610 RepID=UPI0024B20819|nr:SDR family NAD(P)-dependent oxidoreductase [Rhizohabitans arisaemae]
MKNALGAVDSVLLLGGRSEIGLAVVELLVKRGARRIVLAVRGETDAPDLKALGAEVHVVDFDAARPESHGDVVRTAVDLVGDLDVVISAFGVLGDQAVYERDPVSAAHAVAVNFGGQVSVCLHVAERLREQRHGTLIVLSSVAGVRVRKANYVYGSTKAGLDGFAQGLGDALHGSGANVMVVRPGFVRGRMTAGMPPAPMATTPGEVAAAVVAGLREGKETVWAPAVLAPVFALMRVLPRAVWRRMPR